MKTTTTVFILIAFLSCTKDTALTYTLDLKVDPYESGVASYRTNQTSSASQNFEFSPGTIVELTAVAKEGWTFIEWIGDLSHPQSTIKVESNTNNPLEIEMNVSRSITAKFGKVFIIDTDGRLRCPDARPGDKAIINGKKYVAVKTRTDLAKYILDPEYDLSCICTTLVTDLSEMFSAGIKSINTFNQDISNWDVSNVTSMYKMFYRCRFNQDISSWCVEKIKTEPGLFTTNDSWPEEFRPKWGTCP